MQKLSPWLDWRVRQEKFGCRIFDRKRAAKITGGVIYVPADEAELKKIGTINNNFAKKFVAVKAKIS